MPRIIPFFMALACCALLALTGPAYAQSLEAEKLVRMPGTQDDATANVLPQIGSCLSCHGDDDLPETVEVSKTLLPSLSWKGSMMSKSAQDPVFWACLTVALQDSRWALSENTELTGDDLYIAGDICLRCHMPRGWLAGNSTPATNGSAMNEHDLEGITCTFCHSMYDPLYETSTYPDPNAPGAAYPAEWTPEPDLPYGFPWRNTELQSDTSGPIEGGWSFVGYWDEEDGNDPAGPANLMQDTIDTFNLSNAEAMALTLFNGDPFFDLLYIPAPHGVATYDFNRGGEAAGGQYFVDRSLHDDATIGAVQQPYMRGPFGDWYGKGTSSTQHLTAYSRFHKSRFFCATCHDVSNPALANLGADGEQPLPTEINPAYSYNHVERTFSEFQLSGFANIDGMLTDATFAQQTSVLRARKCQDCHMKAVTAPGCNQDGAIVRPSLESIHPDSGMPTHDQTGGNTWLSYILSSLAENLEDGATPNPRYDAGNALLLVDRTAELTMNPNAGEAAPLKTPTALYDGSQRAANMLKVAGAIKDLTLDLTAGHVAFKVQNNTGHKLISGFLEGRRMWVNVKAYYRGQMVYEINPYDQTLGTIKGVPGGEAMLGEGEAYDDALVYECRSKSDLTGETTGSFHFVLADARYKDNRIPPKGFDTSDRSVTPPFGNMEARLVTPVIDGAEDAEYFTPEEYAGGYDQVDLILPVECNKVVVTLYYQGLSREYAAFLRDEINGVDNLTLPAEAYVAQTDAFFQAASDKGLVGWGNTIWNLWAYNHGLITLDGGNIPARAPVPGISPFTMTSASAQVVIPGPTVAPVVTLLTEN